MLEERTGSLRAAALPRRGMCLAQLGGGLDLDAVGEAGTYIIPIEHLEEGFDVFDAAILILEIVGVFPDVHTQNGDMAGGQGGVPDWEWFRWRHCCRGSLDEPCPATAKRRSRRRRSACPGRRPRSRTWYRWPWPIRRRARCLPYPRSATRRSDWRDLHHCCEPRRGADSGTAAGLVTSSSSVLPASSGCAAMAALRLVT